MSEARDRRPAGQRMLRGWTEIAAYCDRTASTVKRWAVEKELPVHRLGHDQAKRGVPVYAYPAELDGWLNAGRAADPAPEAEPDAPARPSPRRQRRGWLLAILTVGALSLAGVGGVAVWQIGGTSQPGQAQAAEIPEEARELYLRGTYLWNRRTPEGIAGAIDALGRAIDIHPGYAEAHAGLAMTYNLARQYSGMPGWDAYARAEEHARRAVELDPSLGFAHSVLAFVEFHWHWNVEAGLARFEEARRLDPNAANTLMWHGSALIVAGRPAEALPILRRAQELDPNSSTILNMKAQALFFSGETTEGVELLEELISRDPGHAWNYYARYFFRLAEGDHAGYLENFARLGDMIGVPRYRIVAEAGAAALADGGVEAMAAAMAKLDAELFERGEALAWDVAGHYALVGNADEALRWLRISLERKEERLIGLHSHPAFFPIRDHPEFKRFAAGVGLPVEV